MEEALPLRGRTVVLVWLCLFWAAVCALAGWQAPGWQWPVAAVGAAAGVLLWRRLGSVRLRPGTDGRMSFSCGRLLQLVSTLPPGEVQRVSITSTPLLRLAGCRLVTLCTIHGSIPLPGVSAAQADALRQTVCIRPAASDSSGKADG